MRTRNHYVGYRYVDEHFRTSLTTRHILAMLTAGVEFQYRDPRGNVIRVGPSSPSPEIKRLLEQDVIWWGRTIDPDWVRKVQHYTELPPARMSVFQSLVDNTHSALKRALKTPGIYLSQCRLSGSLPEGVATILETLGTSEPQKTTRVFFQGDGGVDYADLTQEEIDEVSKRAEGRTFISWTWGVHGKPEWTWATPHGEWFRLNALKFDHHRITFKQPGEWKPLGSPQESYQHAIKKDVEALFAYMDDKFPPTNTSNTENQENTNMNAMNIQSPVPALQVTAVETKAGFVGQVVLGDKIVWESSPVARDAELPEDTRFHSVETYVMGLAQAAVQEFYTSAFDEVTVTGLAPKKTAKK